MSRPTESQALTEFVVGRAFAQSYSLPPESLALIDSIEKGACAEAGPESDADIAWLAAAVRHDNALLLDGGPECQRLIQAIMAVTRLSENAFRDAAGSAMITDERDFSWLALVLMRGPEPEMFYRDGLDPPGKALFTFCSAASDGDAYGRTARNVMIIRRDAVTGLVLTVERVLMIADTRIVAKRTVFIGTAAELELALDIRALGRRMSVDLNL